MNNEKTVNLEKLVAQPQCLKLLILHTPYTLQISTLGRCVNLVKLDLSKNNLQSFPYIGNLQNLKFMFIHDNKLDFPKFKNIFLRQGEIQTKSALMKSITWVTFWGNKNAFLARHFIANNTNALVFDKHMIVPEQRKEAIISYSQEPFCQKSCVQSVLTNNKILGKNATEEQYMDQFWQEMMQLRHKQQQLYPIIKVQKVYRGWIYRLKKKRQKEDLQMQFKIKKQFFKSWLLLVKRQKKLQNILKNNNKEHWLLPFKEMMKQQIYKKMVQLAKKAKLKILMRKLTLNVQIKFYNVLLANLNMFKSLYKDLQIETSKFILINQSSLMSFKKYILPFLQNFNGPDCVSFSTAGNPYQIRQVHDKNSSSRQFIKIISANKRSYVIKRTRTLSITTQNQSKKKYLLSLNHNYCYMFPHQSLKPLFHKIFFNQSQTSRLNRIYSNLVRMDKFHEQEFVIIKGSQRVLKDVVRGVYFFNTRVFGQREQAFNRIHIFSQISVKKLAAVTYIQKNWRGYVFRKKNKQPIQIAFRMRRAVVKIQRWSRNLAFKHRQNFKYKVDMLMKQINCNVFYVQLSKYYEMLQIQSFQSKVNLQGKLVKFIQQKTVPYINYTKKIISLCWNQDTKLGNLNFNMRKLVFDSNYLQKLFKWKPSIIQEKFRIDQEMERVQLSHLFHFNTMVSTIKAGTKHSYIRIQCESTSQCKFRILGLLLSSYQFKNSKFLPIINNELLNSLENIKRKDIINKDAVFVTQGSVILQQGKEKQIQKYECKVKLYLNISSDGKPVKLQQNLLVFIPKRQQISKIQAEQVIVKLPKEPKLKIQSYLITESAIEEEYSYRVKPLKIRNKQPKQLAPHQKRKINIKKSVKSFKMQRKNKQWEQSSLILDNSSIKERLMTQPDLRQKQSSYQIQANLLQYQSQIKEKVKKDFQIKKNLLKKRRDDQSFTKNFINLNNFIQHQYLSQQRRRIKTQIQSDSYKSVDRIKLSEAKASQKLNKIRQNQLKKVHLKHLQHKELLFRNQVLKKQMSQQLKKIKTMQKQKQNLNKGKNHVRKLKVSFAEQCFPIANRGQGKRLGRSQSII